MVIFNMAGLATNIINVMVFVKQGVTSDSITVSFFAMSLSDLLSSALLLPSPLCSFIDLELSNSMRNHCNLTRATNYLHVTFARVTSLIQTYISVERAFSVIFPLHVKHLIKTRNTVIINLVLFMIILAHTLPYLSNVDVIWLQDKDNSTRFIMVENRDARVMSIVKYITMGFVIPSTAIAVNCLATVFIIVRLRLMQKWRRTVSSSASVSISKAQGMSSKNLEMTKTVTVITSMYVISLVCSQICSIAFFTFPEVYFIGLNRYLYDVIYSIRYDIEAMHSTTNMFFYFKMSSRYREMFNLIFCSNQRK
ncbi:G-protein coupled receptor [Biomphalaria pfeifferi]|uniref:G-protein coupled receptor n=1 Tax=Biomphalaria pfeifferi TaxID=112525 RepID=A0AAD8FHX5_BIOPF|nr:G-protein coupled receptor [Biomphalaria pfeifferi]